MQAQSVLDRGQPSGPPRNRPFQRSGVCRSATDAYERSGRTFTELWAISSETPSGPLRRCGATRRKDQKAWRRGAEPAPAARARSPKSIEPPRLLHPHHLPQIVIQGSSATPFGWVAGNIPQLVLTFSGDTILSAPFPLAHWRTLRPSLSKACNCPLQERHMRRPSAVEANLSAKCLCPRPARFCMYRAGRSCRGGQRRFGSSDRRHGHRRRCAVGADRRP